MKRFSIILTLFMAVACGNPADKASKADADSSGNSAVLLLELPTIPETISATEDRAGYLAGHFWDNLNFADTTRSLNMDFMEQNFVNFLSVLPAVMSSDRAIAFDNLMHNASAHNDAYWLIVDMCDKYLMDPNSPMRNEDYYIDFLKSVLKDSVLTPDERLRYEHYFGEAMKVRPGTVAPDFKYVTRSGDKSSLHKAFGKPLVLMFTDPQCDNCKSIIEFMSAHPSVVGPLKSGKLCILAIYPEPDRKVWDNPTHEIPVGWIDGMAVEEGVDSLYPIPAFPSIYLINPNGTVRLKDTSAETLVEAL